MRPAWYPADPLRRGIHEIAGPDELLVVVLLPRVFHPAPPHVGLDGPDWTVMN